MPAPVFVHFGDEDLHVLDGSFGQHPVTQVEYVAAGASRPPKDLPRLRPHVAGRAEKDRGIEVPLDGELPPAVSRALSMGTRQSTPSTSIPAPAIRGSRWHESRPKRMRGTDESREAKSLFTCGKT